MITTNRLFFGIAVFSIIATTMGGCKKETTAIPKTVYQLKVKDQLGISGTVTFTETSSTVTTIDIALAGGDSLSHPAYIQLNSAVEGGAIAVTLTPIVGGKSTTQVSTLDNTSAIDYSQLLVFNGYVSIDESASNLKLIFAQCDIGGNVLTSTSVTYTLDTVDASGVSGTALFQERNNGNTLVSVALNGTLAGATYPATINIGSVTTVGGGPVVKTLNSVDGTSGKSYTNVITLDNGTAASYNSL